MKNYRRENIEKYIQEFYFNDLKYTPGDYFDYLLPRFKGQCCFIKSIQANDDHYLLSLQMETIDEETLGSKKLAIKKGTQLELDVPVDERVAYFVPPSIKRIPVLTEITNVSETSFEIRCTGIGENYCKDQDLAQEKEKKYKENLDLMDHLQYVLYLAGEKIQKYKDNNQEDSEDYKELLKTKNMLNVLIKKLEEEL